MIHLPHTHTSHTHLPYLDVDSHTHTQHWEKEESKNLTINWLLVDGGWRGNGKEN